MIALAAALLLQAAPAAGGRAEAEYFQQEVDYTLEARLDDERELLEGAGVLKYQNKSSQPLDTLYFHLYLNAFRPNSAWAAAEQRQELDFQGLGEAEAGFHRMTGMSAAGAALEAIYPGAPDLSLIHISEPTRPY